MDDQYFIELQKYYERNSITTPFVCATSTGTRSKSTTLQNSLDKIIGETSINRHVTLADLRFTFQEKLYRDGVGIGVISVLMGNKKLIKKYSKPAHATLEQLRKAIESM